MYTGDNVKEVLEFIGTPGAVLLRVVHPPIPIHTLEGTINASAGDWIIRGVKGEFYPCRSDIFEQTYEQVDEDEGPS